MRKGHNLVIGCLLFMCGLGGILYLFTDLKADVSEQEKQLFYEYYLENVKNQNASIMFADLTHDGTEEMILIDFYEKSLQEFTEDINGGFARFFIVDIIDGQPLVIYEDEISWGVSMGNRWYYLYEEDEKEYIFQFVDGVQCGGGYYEYEMFNFNDAGEKIRYIYEREEYRTMMPGSDLEAEDAKLRRISDAALLYEEVSLPLVRVGERLFREQFLEDGERYEKYVFEENELLEKGNQK